MVKKVFSNLSLWALILILWICFLYLGYTGWVQYELMNHQPNDIALNIYQTVQLVSMNSGALAMPIPLALNIAESLASCSCSAFVAGGRPFFFGGLAVGV